MNPNPEPESRFKWNVGGWFGGIVGPTLGLPAYAVAIHEHNPTRALLLLGLFVVALLLALSLWARRARLSARQAVFIAVPVVVVIDVIGSIVIYPLSDPNPLTRFESLDWMSTSAHWAWFIGLWLVIYLVQSRHRSKRT